MAFFSSSYAYDGAQLRRKRSLSKERPSFGDKSRPSFGDKSRPSTADKSDEPSMRKRSPSVHTSSPGAGADSEPRPPLPTPVSAGMSRPRPSAPPDKPPAPASPYDQTSTPIPFTKPLKQASPPPFSNLIIDISRSPSRHSSTAVKLPEPKSLESGDRPDVGSSASREASLLVHEHPTSAQSYVPLSHNPVFLDFTRSKSHSPTRTRPATASASLPSSKPIPSPAKDPGPLSPTLLVGMLPSTSKVSSPKVPTTLPTPVSPPSHSATRPNPDTKPTEHSRSRSHSHTPPSRSPVTETPNPRRGPLLRVKPESPKSPPPSAPASSSGTSTPTPDAKQEKRPRNVLRKPSTVKRESTSAPTSDSERKSKTHRPRARSGAFAAVRRNSGGGTVFDITSPSIPTTSLTPAGEVVVAYKESRRGPPVNYSREASFGNSGKLVAVGAPEDEVSPWTPGWRSIRSQDEGHEDEKRIGLRRSLSRKLSERWGTKEPERLRPEGVHRSASGPADLLHEKARRPASAKRNVSSRKENKIYSPQEVIATRQSMSPVENDDRPGRVWEEDVGDWAFAHARAKEGPDSSSPGRLWRLVKRFSSGNLREKHSPPLEAPPPVPPLPRDLGFAPRTASGDVEKRADIGEMPIPQTAVLETPGGIMRYITSMPSFSIPRTKAPPHGKYASAHGWTDIGPSGGPSTSDVSTRASHRTGTRRSTTTRSSSPSSEGTKLFSRSRSSSDSSYGETVPPMPNASVVQHIVPPHELHLLATETSKEYSTTVRPLQVAPRKGAKPTTPLSSSSSARSIPASVTIPRFEVHNAYNKFAPYTKQPPGSPTPPASQSPDPEPVTPVAAPTSPSRPPPVPARSPRRPSSISIPTLPLAGRQQSLPGVILVQESSESEATDVDAQSRRTSSTATKARPRSISDGAVIPEPTKSLSMARSPLTFREISTTKRTLTEQEKTAKWEDLLQRSDMAGGTLHVGSHAAGDLALWSDRASLAPSETLDRF